MTAQSIDYDSLMQANLTRVFGERDASRRIKAIAELYADDATLYEPPDAAATGHAAISQAVEALLANLPPNFVFTAIGPAVGHHGVGTAALAIRSAGRSCGRDRNRCRPH